MATVPPPDPERLKRQILRRMVDENVATAEGRALSPEARVGHDSGRRPTVGRNGILLLIFFGVLGAIGVWQIVAGSAPPADPTLNVQPAPTPTTEPKFTSVPRPIGPEVFALAIERIILDPGHGGEDTGTAIKGLREKDLTLDIAQRLRNLLKNDFEIILSREDDRALTLRERSDLANARNAHLFVSIHINWFASKTRGVETYFAGATDDPALNEFAQRENAGSGYSMSDMRSLLEKTFLDTRQETSRRFAARVQESLFRSLKLENPELLDRGVKSAPFVVLIATEMPAILAEVSCLSNEREADLLAKPLYRDHIAQALAAGIKRYADEVDPTAGQS